MDRRGKREVGGDRVECVDRVEGPVRKVGGGRDVRGWMKRKEAVL